MEFENKKLRDVADIARQIMFGEDLKGGQVKLDKNHNNKIDAQDFKILKGQKKATEEVQSEEIEQIEELKKSTMGSYVKKASTDLHNQSFEHGEDEHRQYGAPEDDPEAEADMQKRERDIENRKKGINRAATKLSKEEVELHEDNLDSIAKKHGMELKRTTYGAGMKHPTHGEVSINRYGEWNHKGKTGDSSNKFSSLDKHLGSLKEGFEELEEADIEKTATGVKVYGSSYGNSQRARREQIKRPVDDAKGPKMKELKAIESEKKKKMSEMVATFKEQGLKGLFEALKKDEVIAEEPTNDEFTAQLDDAKQRAAGTKKQAEVSKPAVQAVQNEQTHTTVEFIDYNDVNGVKISEIDLDERSLSEPEMKKKEEIVKSMKKGISGFKERYGKDAKSVMYATATKQAKGE